MISFIGLKIGNMGYKLQQPVNVDGKMVNKTGDVLFWMVFAHDNGILNIPISKVDIQANKCIVMSEMLASYNNRARILIKKTENGTSIEPFAGVWECR